MEKVVFPPNTPVTVALKYPDGKLDQSGRFEDQMFYTLADGRCMYLNLDVAAKVNLLGPKRNQPFEICQYWSGKKGDRRQWDVRWPGNVVTMPSAAAVATGIPDTELEEKLAASIVQADARKNARAGASGQTPAPAVPPQGKAEEASNNGNGSKPVTPPPPVETNGNGNGKIPVKIPMNVAFREILQFCTAELKAAGEQWSDQSRQDLISTLLIQAAREGYCTLWERGAK